MTTSDLETRITVLDEHDIAELPPSGHLMTVLVEIPPMNPGTPPHRHSGPVYGYLLAGEMIFELEGEAPRPIRVGETFWEPGGDLIHDQAANVTSEWCRFVVVMAGKPGEPMLTFVDADELEARRDRRHPVAWPGVRSRTLLRSGHVGSGGRAP